MLVETLNLNQHSIHKFIFPNKSEIFTQLAVYIIIQPLCVCLCVCESLSFSLNEI